MIISSKINTSMNMSNINAKDNNSILLMSKSKETIAFPLTGMDLIFCVFHKMSLDHVRGDYIFNSSSQVIENKTQHVPNAIYVKVKNKIPDPKELKSSNFWEIPWELGLSNFIFTEAEEVWKMNLIL